MKSTRLVNSVDHDTTTSEAEPRFVQQHLGGPGDRYDRPDLPVSKDRSTTRRANRDVALSHHKGAIAGACVGDPLLDTGRRVLVDRFLEVIPTIAVDNNAQFLANRALGRHRDLRQSAKRR